MQDQTITLSKSQSCHFMVCGWNFPVGVFLSVQKPGWFTYEAYPGTATRRRRTKTKKENKTQNSFIVEFFTVAPKRIISSETSREKKCPPTSGECFYSDLEKCLCWDECPKQIGEEFYDANVNVLKPSLRLSKMENKLKNEILSIFTLSAHEFCTSAVLFNLIFSE